MTSDGNTSPAATSLVTPPEAEWVPQPASLRAVMAKFATGVTVVTTPGEHSHGMTANAVTSVSLEPELVLCCVGHTARMHASILSARSFAISVLGPGQVELAQYFTDRSRPAGIAQFGAVNWTPGPHIGAPLLYGALAWLECELAEIYEGGDHSIFLGRVLSSRCSDGDEALVFFDGDFRRAA